VTVTITIPFRYATEPAFETYLTVERGFKGVAGQPYQRASWFLLDDLEQSILMLWVSFNSTLPQEAVSFSVGDTYMKVSDTILTPL
jgi:hypothetical protein